MPDRRGFITLSRAVWDHPVFPDEQMSQREAWLWMLNEAAWKDTRVRGAHGAIDLTRGQFSHSFRFLAKKFGWSVNKVRRVFKRYADEYMIEYSNGTPTNTAQLVVTICNYDTYQSGGTETNTAVDTEVDTPVDTQVDTKKNELNKQGNNITEEDKSSSAASGQKIDGKSLLFRQGLSLLASTLGKPENSVRPFIGKLLKAKGDDPWAVMALIEESTSKADPKSWLMACADKPPPERVLSFEEQRDQRIRERERKEIDYWESQAAKLAGQPRLDRIG